MDWFDILITQLLEWCLWRYASWELLCKCRLKSSNNNTVSLLTATRHSFNMRTAAVWILCKKADFLEVAFKGQAIWNIMNDNDAARMWSFLPLCKDCICTNKMLLFLFLPLTFKLKTSLLEKHENLEHVYTKLVRDATRLQFPENSQYVTY